MDILPRRSGVWIGENVRTENFLNFFWKKLRKNLQNLKCLTYLCIVIWKKIAHVSVTFGVRTRCERSRQQQGRKDQTTPLIGKGDLCLRSPQKLKIVWGPQILKPKLLTYESRIDNSYRKFTRCVEEGWLLFPDMQRAADCAKVSSEVDGYTCTKGCTGTLHS